MKAFKARKLIENDYPHILTYNCSFFKSIGIVTPKNIMKHIVEVQKYFRNHQPQLVDQ